MNNNEIIRQKKMYPKRCSVRGCSSIKSPRGSCIFYRFPSDPETHKKWIYVTRKPELDKVGSSTYICSRHFSEDCFESNRPFGLSKILKKDAIPTIFDDDFIAATQKWEKKQEQQKEKEALKKLYRELEKQPVQDTSKKQTNEPPIVQNKSICDNRQELKCWALDCGHVRDNQDCVLFKLPSQSGARKAWLKLINRENDNPPSGTLLCSCHFDSKKTKLTQKQNSIETIATQTTSEIFDSSIVNYNDLTSLLIGNKVNRSNDEQNTYLLSENVISRIKYQNQHEPSVLPTLCNSLEKVGVPSVKNKQVLVDHDYTVILDNDVIESNSVAFTENNEIKIGRNQDFTEINKLCRVCLEPSENLEPLVYSPNLKAYKKLASTTIDPNDNLPKNICHSCQIDFQVATSFVRKSQATERYLKQIKNKSDFSKLYPKVDDYFEMPQRLDESDVSDVFVLPDFDQSDQISDAIPPPSPTLDHFDQSDSPFLSQTAQSDFDSFFTSPPTFKNNIPIDILYETAPSVDASDSQSILCVKCGDLVAKKSFSNHYKKSPSCGPFEKRGEKLCDQCGVVFKDTWLQHWKDSKECFKKVYQCKSCKEWLKNSYKLRRHVLAYHSNDTPYQCHLCSKMFKYDSNLKRHLKVHELGKAFQCELCDKAFYNNYAKTLHVGKEHGAPNPCDYCPCSFENAEKLLIHIQHKHFDQYVTDKESKGEPIEQIHECSICQKPYLSKTVCQNHEKTHNWTRLRQNRSNKNTFSFKKVTDPITRIEKTIWQCNVCQKECSNYQSMYNHEKTVHSEVFRCRYCNKEYKYAHSRRVHELVHTGETPFMCSLCPKAYRSSSALATHRLTHGDRYICQYCDKRFQAKENLLFHERAHRGELPFSCHLCVKRFSNRGSLKKHVKFAHGETEVTNILPPNW